VSIEDFVKSLPKAELHLHLEGAVAATTAIELSRKHGLATQNFEDASKLFDFPDLGAFLKAYDLICRSIVDRDDFHRITYEMLARCAANGARYVEFFFSPQAHLQYGVAYSTMLDGIVAAMRRGTRADQTVMTLALMGLSVPDFWLGLVLIVTFAAGLGWLPSGGFVPITESVSGWLASMAMPALTLALVQMGFIARMTRSAMLDVLHQDFVRTADAKGLSHGFVVLRHALPHAMMPILTVIGIIAGSLLGGAVVVEQVFSLPGVGRLIIGAIMSRDFPVIQGGLLFLALIYLAINLGVDLLYAAIDPRVRP